MKSTTTTLLGIEEIETYFQPIVSLKTGRVFGHEALTRGRKADGSLTPPIELFTEAHRRGVSIELERESRDHAIARFADQRSPTSGLLFLNFSSWMLDDERLEPGRILAACTQAGLSAQDVAIEIVESNVRDGSALTRFAERNRASGFVITLDDFGSDHSNLERVQLVRPDVMKIDRSIICGVAREPYRISVLRSVTYLARAVGALALAEGVERYDDLLACAEEGIDLAQGFIISEPVPSLAESARRASDSFGSLLPRIVRDLRERLAEFGRRRGLFEAAIMPHLRAIEHARREEWQACLTRMVATIGEIECAFLVGSDGVQLTTTVVDSQRIAAGQKGYFVPAGQGESHALKEYVYGLWTVGHDRYLTDRYVSLASGRLVRTLALRVRAAWGEELILCVDIADEESELSGHARVGADVRRR